MTRLAIITLLAAAALFPASSFLLPAMPLSTAGRLAARSNSETRAAPAPHLVRQRRNALAPARMSLEGGEKASKKQIFSAVIALLSSFFLLNVLETAVNEKLNLWPELKTQWNYSGSNDAICKEMAAKGESSELCSDANRVAAQAKLAQKQAYYNAQQQQKQQ